MFFHVVYTLLLEMVIFLMEVVLHVVFYSWLVWLGYRDLMLIGNVFGDLVDLVFSLENDVSSGCVHLSLL